MFGTRAPFIVDLAYLITLLSPVAALISVRLARHRQFRAHQRVQSVTLATAVLVVFILEGQIRWAGGSGALLRGSAYAHTLLLSVLMTVHISCAVMTYIVWIWLWWVSRKKFGGLLPGSFSRLHRRLGWFVISGLLFTAASATAVYLCCFVL